MQKQKENLFLEKFSLLNSQEHAEDIKWSSSSSSDYENTSNSDKLFNVDKTRNRKRKRKKKLRNKNVSNLDIRVIHDSKDHEKDVYREKSPILVTECVENPMSPILKSSRLPPTKLSSPILSHKSFHQKSPKLVLKSASPKYAVKVKRKLAYSENQKCEEQKRISCEPQNNHHSISKKSYRDNNDLSELQMNITNLNSKNVIAIEAKDGTLEISSTDDKSESLNSIKTLNESESSLQAKLNLMKKVKKYFDSHFSSDNTSQNISDTPTPEEFTKNEEISILTCKSQTISSIQPLKNDSTSNSDCSTYLEKSKKVKYKKGGLACRLNLLLKKQNAHVSLWQHEKFLAETSNFVIPKGDHVVFYIEKIDFKYGCYLLDAIDPENVKFVILLNSVYININITAESVFKLYEPYRIFELNKEYKIIVNVCKFECVDLKNLL